MLLRIDALVNDHPTTLVALGPAARQALMDGQSADIPAVGMIPVSSSGQGAPELRVLLLAAPSHRDLAMMVAEASGANPANSTMHGPGGVQVPFDPGGYSGPRSPGPLRIVMGLSRAEEVLLLGFDYEQITALGAGEFYLVSGTPVGLPLAHVTVAGFDDEPQTVSQVTDVLRRCGSDREPLVWCRHPHPVPGFDGQALIHVSRFTDPTQVSHYRLYDPDGTLNSQWDARHGLWYGCCER